MREEVEDSCANLAVSILAESILSRALENVSRTRSRFCGEAVMRRFCGGVDGGGEYCTG